MDRSRLLPALLLSLALPAWAQDARPDPTTRIAATSNAPSALPPSASPADPNARAPQAHGDVGFAPTWETQKHARTYLLGIPAPRGQIVDRNGEPLAQSRVSYNLAVEFPTPLTFSDQQVVAFVQAQASVARSIVARPIIINPALAVKHYKNRGVVPFVIVQDLTPAEQDAFAREKPANLKLQPIYLRFYPNGPLAGHIIGYAGRSGKAAEGTIENNELLWPGAEGREGLEQTFDAQLQGKVGQLNISFDASGKRVSEQISIPPQPGLNVVTTLDIKLQRLCEDTLAKGLKRGAMVIVDPGSGDILAMASWPGINPNQFIPSISQEQFSALEKDPNIPLLPRAYRSAYPPGSTFKVFVGLAALQSGKVKPNDLFSCPASLEIGNLVFRNWKKTASGDLNFVDALTQSCDTWFYQVGMKIGAHPIVDYAQQVGLGKKTGIPLAAEADGLIPTDEYMLKVHGRKILNGDVANLSIGQGDTLVTPLQLAEAMGVIGNGGTVFQTRLVQQVQSLDGQIVNAYNVRARSEVEIDKTVMKNIRRGMVQVVSSKSGTAGRAAVPNVDVAGKTGTAEWGPKKHEKTAAWFAGFAPADDPKYAFAVVYEGDAGLTDVHGGTVAAPLIGKVLRDVFKGEKPQKKGKHDDDDDSDSNNGDEPPVHHSKPPEHAPPPPPPPRPSSPIGNFFRRLFG